MMYPTQLTHLSLLALLSPLPALARTDLSGCTSFTSMVTVNPTAQGYGNVYPSVMYYVPDTLEICTIPDCGGGRAPPKTGVPGCPLYSGTATPTPSFLTADPLAPPAAASTVAAAASGVAPGGALSEAPEASEVAAESSDVAAESLSVAAAAAAETQATGSATEAAVHALMMSSSATDTATATAATVTSSLVLVNNVSATGTSTGGSAPEATGVGPMGIKKGNATAGNGTGAGKGAAPNNSSSMQTTSYGDVVRVTVGLFSAAIAMAAAFVL